MWIVNLALRRPYTFIVLAVFILIAGVLSIFSTPKDIFPSINIPVISVIWTYTGMAPRDISDHLTSPYERVLTTTVDNIEHIESESLYGIAIVKIFLQPNASVPQGIAQVTAVSQTILKQLPIATTPPLILSYSATNVPVLMVGLSGLSEQQLNDYGLNFIRTQLITVPGAAGLRNAGKLVALVLGFAAASTLLYPFLGQNFFPSVDTGQFEMHVRMRAGTRIEETAQTVDQIEQMMRQIIPANQVQMIVDNTGIPYSGINLSYNTTGTMSSADCDILVSLKENHDPTNQFVETIRTRMHQDFPDVGVWFPPADIVSQTLNFGLPAPIDIQITGADLVANTKFASRLMEQIRHVAGAVDFRIQEPNDVPQFNVTIDRSLASIVGVNAQAITQSVLGALSGSLQVAPNFWVDPRNRVSYQINAQAPQYDLHSLDDLRNLPILGGTSGQAQIVANVASLSRATTSPVEDHYNIRPVINIYGGADGKDLGYVSDHIQKLVDAARKDLPRGSFISVRGQVNTMHDSYTGLYVGLAFSMLLAYLLMVVNFQSWIQPLIIITALPCALAGIIWMLFVTGTTLSVPALMGAITCMGVATANSVLVVTFANELLDRYKDPYRAALEAGYVRLRPVLMTALAMIIGMVPMALGLGDGGEQNAPLGRAVIGGLIFATAATLFFVPTVFMVVNKMKRVGTQDVSPEPALG
jgi:multidrug efflux pump subunit AcrB